MESTPKAPVSVAVNAIDVLSLIGTNEFDLGWKENSAAAHMYVAEIYAILIAFNMP